MSIRRSWKFSCRTDDCHLRSTGCYETRILGLSSLGVPAHENTAVAALHRSSSHQSTSPATNSEYLAHIR
jgi:hypothetical protein